MPITLLQPPNGGQSISPRAWASEITRCRTKAERQASKAANLQPFIEAALARKPRMLPLEDHEIPVVRASVAKAQTSGSLA